jgi:hypothetical protein
VNIPRNVAVVAICGTRYVNVNVPVFGSVPTPYNVGGGVPVAIVTPVTDVVIVGFPYASLAEMTMLYKSTIGMAFGAVLVSPDMEALDDRSRTRVNVPTASAEPLHTYWTATALVDSLNCITTELIASPIVYVRGSDVRVYAVSVTGDAIDNAWVTESSVTDETDAVEGSFCTASL